MACLQMYNNQNNNQSPRLSFSNDFIESNNFTRTYRDAPVSSDFEFSVTKNSMINSADELFSQGRLLPLKESSSSSKSNNKQMKMMTLKDELEVVDEVEDEVAEEGFSLKPPKSSSSTRWKGFLGLKTKSHIGSKKLDKNGGSSSQQRPTSQEMMNDGSTSSCSKN